MRFADNRNKIGKYIPAVVFLISYTEWLCGLSFLRNPTTALPKKILAEVSGGDSRKIAFG